MNEEGCTGSAEDEQVIALTSDQLGAVFALLIAIFLVFRAVLRKG